MSCTDDPAGTAAPPGTGRATGTVDLPEEPVELVDGGACGDAWFWAATASGDVAVTVSVDARRRSSTESTTLTIVADDPEVTIEVLRGTNLDANFCTDVVIEESEESWSGTATAGTGQITLEPTDPSQTSNCGADGTLRLDGLVADDGTTFAPIEVRSPYIGCYAG